MPNLKTGIPIKRAINGELVWFYRTALSFLISNQPVPRSLFNWL